MIRDLRAYLHTAFSSFPALRRIAIVTPAHLMRDELGSSANLFASAAFSAIHWHDRRSISCRRRCRGLDGRGEKGETARCRRYYQR